MTDSGRLRTAASPQIRAMLLERPATPRPAWKAELDRICLVDLAHVVMLAERGITERPVASALLSAVQDLRKQDFAPLEHLPTPRGLYLAYEGYLIELLGEGVGGVLQTGRSRNDLNATCLQLALREPYKRLARELTALGTVLTNRARRYRDVLMPVHTHFQAAMPITFGHYLLGLSHAVERDLQSLAHAARGLARSPLGGGSVGGTTVPIDPERTAHLLGFTEPVANSVDAIASRDTALRMLSTCAILGVTLDRAALDLLMWSSAEFGMLTVPDGLVGSSSMMPQKRNAFVLEHVQGKSAAALGALTAAVSAMRGTPFTNSIAVGTEAMSHVMAALYTTADAVKIMRLAYQGVRPVPEVMARRATEGLTNATATAEWLVGQGVPFRRAHYQVGQAATAVLAGEVDSLGEGLARNGHTPKAPLPDLGPEAVRRAARFGGGPGPAAFERAFGPLAARWLEHRAAHLRQEAAWERSTERLMETVDAVCAPATATAAGSVTGEGTVRGA
ncbi:argininosuccinate lyase [Streptomyces sulfonofaciens]|uniref:Argininosuccinate lyase n=1 Tax=Streptomyces sulfonofaciens TaxID=68272 RepID=A0A919GJJ5_9ACTN|nr:argininosuccinate lyase [Streptomyces sulfonofaciens]GHH85673.1 argininosuccinate lyase [Streptomyces sulfonofaciens]